MVLEPHHSSMHNRMLGTKIPHPKSTNFDEDFPNPPAKKAKITLDSPSKRSDLREEKAHGSPRQKRNTKVEISDSEDEDLAEISEQPLLQKTTELESTLPLIQTDAEAIEAYEAYRAGLHQENDSNIKSRFDNQSWIRGRSSIYVDAFNLALETVLDEEKHLFNAAELQLFEDWKGLDYESQYLYVRLFLRKTSKWFRVKDLPYYSDVSNVEAAVSNLQKQRPLPKIEHEEQIHPGELETPEGTEVGDSFTFAECSSEHISSLDEASSLLLLEELKVIAKEAKVQGKNKTELLHNLRRTSGRQTGLGFRNLDRTNTEESNGSAVSEDSRSVANEKESLSRPTTPDPSVNRDAHFTKKILDTTGRCIRLTLAPLKLFERVHLVFYKSTEWTEKSLTTIILANISRLNFPQYIVSRSANIFESRSLLLEFEASLRTQFRVDDIMEFSGTPGRIGAEKIKEIFEAVYPRWKVLLRDEQRKEDRVYESGEGAYLRRFNPAWVYTRIVHKGLWPLARHKEHKREHDVLTELLDQRLFHAARRGAWYQRKALLEEHYMYGLTPSEGRSEEVNKKYWKKIAIRTCEEGLEDRECHIIYHYDLQKRIRKLEKQLRVPLREQHDFGHVRLSKAAERTVYGIKIEREETPARSLSRKSSVNEAFGKAAAENATAFVKKGGGKTVWFDELDTNELVSVESMCLSYYRKELGWKGYHSEGGIVRMLFGLLFCDVLFAYVPNVFQTAYQTCPLDLHTDAFHETRISEINARINQIANGDAERLIQDVWDTHFERRTCVVGVRWDEYELSDILEIARCFRGEALGTVMRVMAQDYAGRGGGVPDLFLWKLNDDSTGGEVMFVEVKSENDRLSDTQRLWISVLLGAGIPVELCHALAKEVRAG